MTKLQWIKHFNRKMGIQEYHLEITQPRREGTFDYTARIFTIGQYRDDKTWQVYLDSPWGFILDMDKNFRTAKNCMKYVDKEIRLSIKELAEILSKRKKK